MRSRLQLVDLILYEKPSTQIPNKQTAELSILPSIYSLVPTSSIHSSFKPIIIIDCHCQLMSFVSHVHRATVIPTSDEVGI